MTGPNDFMGLQPKIPFADKGSSSLQPELKINISLWISIPKDKYFNPLTAIWITKTTMHTITCISISPSSPRKWVPSMLAKGSRRAVIMLPLIGLGSMVALSAYGKGKINSPYDERRLLEQNKKIQEANKAPKDFPNFVREGFEVKVVTPENYVKCDSGLIYLDIEVGKGDCPKDGQQVIFQYIGFNESGRRIDSSYQQGAPAKIRLGNKALVPGFEEGIRDMRPGGKRRIIIPPDLGPPVGPSTFFSAKQYEVFDVELLDVQDCQRRTIAFYSDVVCN